MPSSRVSVRAGQLRDRVQFQSATKTRNAAGEAVLTWTTYWTCWAYVQPTSGIDDLVDGNKVVQRMYRVFIRHTDSDITPQHRIVIVKDDRVLNITAVVNVHERDRMIRL